MVLGFETQGLKLVRQVFSYVSQCPSPRQYILRLVSKKVSTGWTPGRVLELGKELSILSLNQNQKSGVSPYWKTTMYESINTIYDYNEKNFLWSSVYYSWM
jgi:hypothetical protein